MTTASIPMHRVNLATLRSCLSVPIWACILVLVLIWAADAWPVILTIPGGGTDVSVRSLRVFPKRDDTGDVLRDQFINPQGIIAVLLLIGGDVVQKAIAQGTGGKHDIFTPVVFSFGWVSYAFNSVAGAIGEGTFLPPPDCPATVINVTSGDRRDNQSWVLGRLLRDMELKVEAETDMSELDSGLLVTVYKAESDKSRHRKTIRPRRNWLWFWFAIGVTMQLAVAAGPIYAPWRDDSPPRRDWSIVLITVAGNFLAACSSFIPSMRKEKYQGTKSSHHTYAITRGNGHKHVFIILPDTMAKGESCLPSLDQMATARDRAYFTHRLLSIIPAILWVILLLIVGGLTNHTWFLLGVGVLGMIHNILLSGWRLEPKTHGIPIAPYSALGRKRAGGERPKVMKVLMEAEKKFPGVGHALLPVFFPGRHEREPWMDRAVSEKTMGKRLQMRQLDWYSPEQLPKNHPAHPDVEVQDAAAEVAQAQDAVRRVQEARELASWVMDMCHRAASHKTETKPAFLIKHN
ncbi:hypothetical protein GGR52DRAFT_171747 [Hypoxylon sp. FL1284]|nr:hypothetical protein GGR52DRAFT_171747 [Hypoxylon sp. FL1284]